MKKSVKKILILAANPLHNELPRLRLDEEVKQIRTSLQLAENRTSFAIEAYGSVRPEELQQYLYEIKPQIVHFSGHGIGKQGLAFEDEDGGVKLVSSETLGNLFRLFAREIECVVLNACYAEVQAEIIRAYIPYVIGMKEAIGDRAARTFAGGFYRGIWDGKTIEDAFASGVNAIDLAAIPEGSIPVLLSQKTLKVNSPNSAIPIVARGGVFFVVRSHQEQRCEQELTKPGALVRIKSPEKMGKTWMMGRVLEAATQRGFRTATIDLGGSKSTNLGGY
ncbi:MAG: CHAT domain-containing protein [Coleofasciculaceae cyanobacterium SM2_1_6]|nr:CHAT domain-containing protein [Coleofasciculaceae cyanobacterium SM2_1_6]